MQKVLLIDNYDSFVYNLARYVGLLGFEREVVRNDAITFEEIEAFNPLAIIISPGPCTPAEAGISVSVIQHFYQKYPILGICLGHQAIAQGFGGKIIRAKRPMHGMSSKIFHKQTGIFEGLQNPLQVGRYHSLIVCEKTLPPCLKILAYCKDRQIMAIEHTSFPVVGLQFHPESIITEGSFGLLQNFFNKIPFNTNKDLLKLESTQFDTSY